MSTASWLSLLIALLLVLAAARRVLGRQSPGRSELDDEAIERILTHGTYTTPGDEPLDEEEIARAEEEFWEESWDDPEEY